MTGISPNQEETCRWCPIQQDSLSETTWCPGV